MKLSGHKNLNPWSDPGPLTECDVHPDNHNQLSGDESHSDYDDFARCSGTPSNMCSSPKNSEYIFAEENFQNNASQ